MDKQTSKIQGFTLIETMVVVAILSIVLITATVTYTNYLTQSRRAEAIQTLLSLQMAQENYRATHTTYGSLADIWGGRNQTENAHYRLLAYNLSSTTYALLAMAEGNQANDTQDGTSCRFLFLWKTNGNEFTFPTVCWEK